MKTTKWTHQQIEYLHEFAESKSVASLAERLNRTSEDVRSIMIQLGIQHTELSGQNGDKNKKYTLWTDTEINYLRQHYSTRTRTEMAKSLNRTIVSVSNKAREIGIGPAYRDYLGTGSWSEQQDQYLIENWLCQTEAQLSRELRKTFHAISHRAVIKGLPEREKCKIRTWTAEENEYLLNNWPAQTKKQIAQALNRSVCSVITRIQEQNWTAKNLVSGEFKRGKWTPEEDQYLRDNYATRSFAGIGSQLNRKRRSVDDRVAQLKLKRTDEQKRQLLLSPDSLTDISVAGYITTNSDQRRNLLNYPSIINLQRARILLTQKIKQL
ncbi:hypothetical protein [Spirosoma arcticum]